MKGKSKKHVMPIGGYYGPYRLWDATRKKNYDFITKDIYTKIQDVGINLLVKCDNDYALQPQVVKDNLALAEEANIGVYITDSATREVPEHADMNDYFAELKEYNSFYGLSIIDEPCTKEYGPSGAWEMDLRRLPAFVNQSCMVNRSDRYDGYVNLFPMYDFLSRKDDTVTDYRIHLIECIETCKVKQLSWDHYPFDRYRGDNDLVQVNQEYFRNLSIVREVSLEYKIPFWGYIQAGSNWNDDMVNGVTTSNDIPTKGQFLWNVNTTLAYGAKGIQYFPLIQPYFFAYAPEGQYDYERNGLIGANGEPTKWYEYAKQANEFIAKVDEILMDCTSEKILAVGTKAQTETGIQEDTDDMLKSVVADNEVLIGVFQYQGKKMYYVVNYDMEADNMIHMNLIKKERMSIYAMDSEKYELGSDVSSILLSPGSAALIIVQ